MPRAPRRKSESGIYHVILRGINQQVIFEEHKDYTKFLSTIRKYKEISGFKLYAYCLMSNHIHMLIKVEKEDIDLIFKRIAGSYVYWYNWKYQRKGHLFQDRFKSEPIEDDAYFLTVLRYVHQNPIKANIVENVGEYLYSSYAEYVGENNTLVDIDFALSIMEKAEFIEYINMSNSDECLEIEKQVFRLNDDEAIKIIEDISGCKTIAEFQALDEGERIKNIQTFKEKGISIRQISRLTGISKGIVERI